nr:alpha/beta hydrolase [Sphingobium sp. JAI105]
MLLHGSRDHCRSWDWAARALASRWNVIAPDLRGHGDSQWSAEGSYSVSAYLYDLCELVRIRELDRIPIVAHSLGGTIAARYVALFPERVSRLLLVDGAGIPRSPESDSAPVADRLRQWLEDRRSFAMRPSHRYESFAAAEARMRAENAHLSDELLRHLTLHAVRRNEDDSYSWKFDNLIRLRPPQDGSEAELITLFNSITVPTMMIWGTQSYTPPPRESSRVQAIPGIDIREIEGASHWPHHDAPELFLKLLDEFLDPAIDRPLSDSVEA